MLTYLKRLLTDEGAFIGFTKAALGGFAVLATEGEVLGKVLAPETANIVGAVSMGVALMLSRGPAAKNGNGVPKP